MFTCKHFHMHLGLLLKLIFEFIDFLLLKWESAHQSLTCPLIWWLLTCWILINIWPNTISEMTTIKFLFVETWVKLWATVHFGFDQSLACLIRIKLPKLNLFKVLSATCKIVTVHTLLKLECRHHLWRPQNQCYQNEPRYAAKFAGKHAKFDQLSALPWRSLCLSHNPNQCGFVFEVIIVALDEKPTQSDLRQTFTFLVLHGGYSLTENISNRC